MRNIKGLTTPKVENVRQNLQIEQIFQVRQRAHCIQLSWRGYTADFGPMMYRVNGKNHVVRASCPRERTS